jgi:aspartate aminotransferase-like enzyme
MLKKTRLLTPGPTMIPERVQQAMGQPILHHRTPGFAELFQEIQRGLKYFFQTQNDVLSILTSGTGAMDAAVCNLFSPGDCVITINGGKFGARWTKIAEAYQLQPIEITLAPGETLAMAQLENAYLAATNKGLIPKALLCQASETSTGLLYPVQAIADWARRIRTSNSNFLLVVDAITALGVFELPMDDFDIDVLITGSQKALMIPPGLAFLALSNRAWQAVDSSKINKFYLDFKKERKGLSKGQTAWTPGTTLLMGLAESLKIVQEESLPEAFKRHALLAEATRLAIKAMGLKLLSEKAPSNAVTAVCVPAEIENGKLIPKTMRDEFGVTIAGGQDALEGKIFRLTHLGYIDRFDIITGISALELCLYKLGYQKFSLGAGVTAALNYFNLQESQL